MRSFQITYRPCQSYWNNAIDFYSLFKQNFITHHILVGNTIRQPFNSTVHFHFTIYIIIWNISKIFRNNTFQFRLGSYYCFMNVSSGYFDNGLNRSPYCDYFRSMSTEIVLVRSTNTALKQYDGQMLFLTSQLDIIYRLTCSTWSKGLHRQTLD